MKIVLSGGPHTGKTTIFKRLKKKYPKMYFIPEAGGLVIKEMIDLGEEIKWTSEFQKRIIQKAIDCENRIPENTITILDRSIIDSIAYYNFHGLPDSAAKSKVLVKNAKYSKIFFCEHVGGYKKNEIRRESEEEAEALHKYIFTACKESGIDMTILPNISVEKRIKIISEFIEHLE